MVLPVDVQRDERDGSGGIGAGDFAAMRHVVDVGHSQQGDHVPVPTDGTVLQALDERRLLVLPTLAQDGETTGQAVTHESAPSRPRLSNDVRTNNVR